jgi:hypothetical protein
MINEVRNSVLAVLNKNNYGYISPSDFNLYAKNAQMELFEEYFSNYNKTISLENLRQVGTDYADINKTIAEVLDQFLVYDYLMPFFTPQGYFSNRYNVPNAVDNVSGESYMINKIMYYSNNIANASASSAITSTNAITCDPTDFVALNVSLGDIILNLSSFTYSTVVGINTINTPNDTIITADDIFLIGSLPNIAIFSVSQFSEAERVTNGKIDMLNASHLTSPTLKYPAYTQTQNSIVVYPYVTSQSKFGAVKAAYFRYPKDPKWTYISLSGGEPVFSQSQPDYQDFEMPFEDGYKLVMKICQYCGISIREADVTNFAMAQEQHEQPSFSVQQ